MSTWEIYIAIAVCLLSGSPRKFGNCTSHEYRHGVDRGGGPPFKPPNHRPSPREGTNRWPHSSHRPPRTDEYPTQDGSEFYSPSPSWASYPVLITLDLSVRMSTDYFKYYRDRNNGSDVYVTRHPYLFKAVVNLDRTVWHARNGPYAKQITIGPNRRGIPTITVLFPKPMTQYDHRGHRYRPDRDDYYTHPGHHRGFEPEYHRGLRPVILDIDLRHTLEYKYHWNSRDRLHMFTANHPYAFHSIVRRGRVLWRARDNKYPVKVTIGQNHRGKLSFAVYYPQPRDHRLRRAHRHKELRIQHQYRNGNIIGVRCDDVQVWRHDGTGPYPHTTKSISDIMMFAIIFDRTHFHVYKFDGERWDRIRASIDATISLDINNRSSTPHYYYSSHGHIGTYLPAENYLFNTVKLTNLRFRGLTTDIWHTDNPLEYARKVVVNRHKYLTFAMEVTIHYTNGCEVMLSSQGLTNAFGLLRWSMPAPRPERDIRIITLDRHGHEEVNNASKFDVYNHWKRDIVGSNLQAIYKCVVMFYKRANCVRVEYQGSIIWKDRSREDHSELTKITFNIDTNEHYLEFTDNVNNFVYKGHTPSPLFAL